MAENALISRLVIEMERMPLQYSHFTIETWVEAVNKLFTSRNFAIADESHYGDTLDYYIDDNGNSQYSVEVKKKDSGEVVCRSLIIFTLP